ncbi:hypothetical protein BP5796_00193 [Coleophoma crateriformis]|uniref:GEgh 16 protein n=1 Tax=Coleophoma crateriformis TaxID=565419 RepID=A0A3D8T7C2_9HELO|nr:hypothetical protein BP5796_00193 [Coleophoma crateriformis]
MLSSILYSAALVSLASAHGVILAAQGDAGSPASVGFQVDASIARNCTGISPCQQDTTIIRDSEITQNIVNECGRTELTGNIDVGENTEAALAAKAVTSVKAGSSVTVTLHQVNADGAGPYSCDIDMTSNAGIISQNLTVTNNVPGVNGLSSAKTTDFNITVQMPTNLKCVGASTGNVCTVRCRNNAVAGPFGGCFAVQQTDTTANVNSANQITTSQSLAAVQAQILQNQKDLPVAVEMNQNQGTTEALAAAVVANNLAGHSVTTTAFPTQTLAIENINGAAATSAAAAATTTSAAKASTTSKASKASKAAKGAKASKRAVDESAAAALKWAKRAMGAEDSA